MPVGGVEQVAHGHAGDERGLIVVDDLDGHGAVPPADNGGDHEVADGQRQGAQLAEDLHADGVEPGFFDRFA